MAAPCSHGRWDCLIGSDQRCLAMNSSLWLNPEALPLPLPAKSRGRLCRSSTLRSKTLPIRFVPLLLLPILLLPLPLLVLLQHNLCCIRHPPGVCLLFSYQHRFLAPVCVFRSPAWVDSTRRSLRSCSFTCCSWTCGLID